MGRSRYKTLEEHETYFVTCATVKWLPLFSHPELADIVLESWRFVREAHRLSIHAYVLMENHFHIVTSSQKISHEMRTSKSFTARRIVDTLGELGFTGLLDELRFAKKSHKSNQVYQVWQEGFHPEAIHNSEMLLQKVEYIHNNPIRRGFVDDPAHWRYSSYRQYAGGTGLVPVELLLLT